MGRKIELATRILHLGMYETLATWGRTHERLEHVKGLLVKDPQGRVWETMPELYDGYTDESHVPLVDPKSGQTSAADYFKYNRYRVVGQVPQNKPASSLVSHL